VSWLFPDEATETSTDRVKEHYREQGFNPANEIRPELEARVRDLLPEGKTPRAFRIETVLLLLVGVGALLLAWFLEGPPATSVVLLEIGVVVLAGIGVIAGAVFRGNIQWGPAAAWLCLLPALCLAAATAVFLWSYAGTGLVELSAEALVGIVAITLSLTNASINALRSRDSREAIALRKTLAAGREFFVSQLRKDRPALRDEWYPWLLAFGLAREVDDWSARRERQQPNEKDNWVRDSNPTSSSGTAEPQWTGFGGGRSGGAGASGSWAAAAGGMAAGVSAPRASESSGGSGSDSGSSSSSSSSASSGGGGGGGW
jgi:uncharacterized membrane protein YgcG